MAALTVYTSNRDGEEVVFESPGASATVANNGRTTVLIHNTSGAILNIGQVIVKTVDGVTPDPKPATVANNSWASVGPWDRDIYSDPVTLTFDQLTGVSVVALTY